MGGEVVGTVGTGMVDDQPVASSGQTIEPHLYLADHIP